MGLQWVPSGPRDSVEHRLSSPCRLFPLSRQCSAPTPGVFLAMSCVSPARIKTARRGDRLPVHPDVDRGRSSHKTCSPRAATELGPALNPDPGSVLLPAHPGHRLSKTHLPAPGGTGRDVGGGTA